MHTAPMNVVRALLSTGQCVAPRSMLLVASVAALCAGCHTAPPAEPAQPAPPASAAAAVESPARSASAAPAAPAAPAASPKPAPVAPATPAAAPAIPAVEPPASAEPASAEATAQDRWSQAELEKISAEIQADVEVLRGMPFKSKVAVKITDKKGFIDYAHQRLAETESPEKLARDETVAKLLGFVPPQMDLMKTTLALLEEQVGGFYDPSTNTFYLMDTFTGGVAKVIMAHELTHALDDQHFDLDGSLERLGGMTDATFAFQAVVEGSGMNLMTQWTKAHIGEVSMEDLSRAQGSMGAEQLAEAPPFLWKPLLAVYLRGDSFLVKTASFNMLGKDAKREDVERAFEEPPRSSEQILHPAKYWKADKIDEPMTVTIDTSKLASGWTKAGEDTLGEIYLALMTTPPAERKGLDPTSQTAVLGVKYTNKAAEGWGGDRLVLLERGDDRIVELVTAWDTAKDADEFAAALGDASKLEFIGPMTGSASDAKPGMTPTAARIMRAKAADGKTAVVILRVGSFASGSGSELEQLELQWSVATKAGMPHEPK